jgi:hypothetical protein
MYKLVTLIALALLTLVRSCSDRVMTMQLCLMLALSRFEPATSSPTTSLTEGNTIDAAFKAKGKKYFVSL